MKKYKFGVLGAGNMGTAIAEGAVRAGRFAPEQVLSRRMNCWPSM